MEDVAQSLHRGDSDNSAEDSAEDMDDQHFGGYLINQNVLSRCQIIFF
jgi:hypothetical protein